MAKPAEKRLPSGWASRIVASLISSDTATNPQVPRGMTTRVLMARPMLRWFRDHPGMPFGFASDRAFSSRGDRFSVLGPERASKIEFLQGIFRSITHLANYPSRNRRRISSDGGFLRGAY